MMMESNWSFSAATLKSTLPRSTLNNSKFLQSSFSTAAISSKSNSLSVPSNSISPTFDQQSSSSPTNKRFREEEIEERGDRLSRSEGDSRTKRRKKDHSFSIVPLLLSPVQSAFHRICQFFSVPTSKKKKHRTTERTSRFQLEMEEEIQQNEEETEETPYLQNTSRKPNIDISPISRHTNQSMDRSILDQSITSQLNDSFRELSVLDELKREQNRRTFDTWKNQIVNKRTLNQSLNTSLDRSPSPAKSQNGVPKFGSMLSRISTDDQDYKAQFTQATLRMKESQMEMQATLKDLRARVPELEDSIDLTQDDQFLESRHGLTSLVTAERRLNIQKLLEIEEERKREEEKLQKLEKLRMLAEASQKQNEEYLHALMRPKKDEFPKLTVEEEEVIERALAGDDENEDVVSEAFNIKVTKADIARLREFEWLNDEIVNFYFLLLDDRNKKNPQDYPKCHFFNSFFYPLLQKGYSRVAKWTKKVDIFSMDKVILPIHLGNHWCLAVINFQDKRFEYYDSLGGDNPQCLQLLRQYLQQEHKSKKNKDFELSDWEEYSPKSIPRQRNGYDCGLFMCRYAECVSRRKGFNFEQRNMPYFRKRMVLDILNKHFSV